MGADEVGTLLGLTERRDPRQAHWGPQGPHSEHGWR